MRSIKTMYIGPTNNRGARIKAIDKGGHGMKDVTITLSWDYSLNVYGNHASAARAMIGKMEWTGIWVSGVYDGDYYWTFVSNQYVKESGIKIEDGAK